jgi:hypothetical protein
MRVVVFVATVFAIVAAAAVSASAASSAVEQEYVRCLENLIAAKGFKYAVRHAGNTHCERRAAAR